MLKHKIFKIIHDTDIEIYMMWIIIFITILTLLVYILYYFSDYSETYVFIKDL